MASNPMQKKSRNSFLLGMFLMLIISAIIMVIIVVILTKNNKKQEVTENVKQSNIFVVKNQIQSGSEITIEDLELKAVNADTIPEDAYGAANLEDLYKEIKNENGESETVPKYKTKINLSTGTVLSESMLYEGEELKASERIQEYNMLQLPVMIEPGEYVDIRLLMSNGQDYIVVSHKQVIAVSGSTIWLQLSEEETLLMSNAIVESYVSPASNLYVAKYVEPGMQSAATITYIPSPEVITLIRENGNIVDSAKNALITKYNENQGFRTNIQTELNNFGEERIDNIQEKILEARDKAIEEREAFLNGVE